MKVGELFVNFGIKGTAKAGKAFGEVKTGMSEIKAMSIEAKAAIVGAIYALERMMSSSTQGASGMAQFNAATGIGIKQLQQWRYAAQQVHVTNGDIESSLAGVQSKMADMMMNPNSAPSGYAQVANLVGMDINQVRNPEYVMEQLRKATMILPPDVGNALIGSFGVNQSTISGFRQGGMTREALDSAPVLSDKVVKTNAKLDVQLANLKSTFERGMAGLTAKFGPELVKDLATLIPKILELISAFAALAQQINLLGAIGKIFEGWGLIFTGISDVVKQITDATKTDKDEDEITKGMSWSEKWEHWRSPEFQAKMDKQYKDQQPWSVHLRPVQQNPAKHGGVVIENQNLTFLHDGKDASKIADSHRKAARDAYRQSAAQAGGQ